MFVTGWNGPSRHMKDWMEHYGLDWKKMEAAELAKIKDEEKAAKAAKDKGEAKKAAPAGKLTEKILELLKVAGEKGVTVKELAASLKVKPGSVFSWFYAEGKKIKAVIKVGEAKYGYRATEPVTAKAGAK